MTNNAKMQVAARFTELLKEMIATYGDWCENNETIHVEQKDHQPGAPAFSLTIGPAAVDEIREREHYPELASGLIDAIKSIK